MTEHVDLIVVGGGINGAGIARDAAGRGISVLLCERDDLANHTSSWSSKLVHGGLRYLEQYEFRLVRESLKEREVLMQAAPHLIRPLRFVLPHHSGLRPAWLLRMGLFLYDHIGGRKLLPATKSVDLTQSELGAPLKDEYRRGFEYSDCFADDSRLVVVNAVDAKLRGAQILTRTSLTSAARRDGRWHCQLQGQDGEVRTATADVLVNAAGPWVTKIIDGIEGAQARKAIRLVKGSHIIVNTRFNHDRAYILQNADGRIVFAIPYLDGSTLVGTTDVAYQGNPAEAAISDEEIDYLLDLLNGYMKEPCRRQDILSTYSGVRPLYDDLSRDDVSTITRDYAFDIDDEDGGLPLLSVYGGKLTTYRKLAEHALDKLAAYFPNAGGAWTKRSFLPGADFGYTAFSNLQSDLARSYPQLPKSHLQRIMRTHGSDTASVLGSDPGKDLGYGLYKSEVVHFKDREFATSPEDILFRRTKIGLSDRDGTVAAALAAFF